MRAYLLDSKGFRYYGGTLGDDVVFLSHSDYTVTAAANAVADAELAEQTDDANTVSLSLRIQPTNGDDTPFIDFTVGDAVQAPDIDGDPTTYRVVEITVTEDATGNAIYDLGLNSLLEVDGERQANAINSLTPGALGGRGQPIQATDLGLGIPFAPLQVSELGTFSQSAYLVAEIDSSDPTDAGHSEWWPLDENQLLYRHPWVLNQAGSSDTVVVVRYRHPDGTTIDEFGYTIASGVAQPDATDSTDHASFYTNLAADKGGAIQVAITSAGDFAYGITWRTKMTTQV